MTIIITVALQSFVIWLNTEKGGKWITKQINTALRETSYTIQTHDFSLSGIWGLKAGRLKILDNDQLLAASENLSLRIGLLSLGLKHLDIDLSASSLSVKNLPESKSDKKSMGTQSIALPNLYFKTIKINIDLKDFYLSETLLEGGFRSHFKIKQDLKIIKENIVFTGTILLQNVQHRFSEYIPDRIDNRLKFNPQNQTLYFDEIIAKKENNLIALSGQFGFQDSRIKTNILTEWIAPQNFAAHLKEVVTLKGDIEGKMKDLSGKFRVSTRYQGHEMVIQSKTRWKDELVILSDIKGHGGLIEITGKLNYNIETTFAEGFIDATLQDFTFLRQFINIVDLSGSGSAELKLSSENGTQSASLNSHLSQMKYQDYTAEKIKARFHAEDIKNIKNVNAEIRLLGGKIDTVDIKNMDMNISSKAEQYDVVVSGKAHSYRPFIVSATGRVHRLDPFLISVSEAELTAGKGIIKFSGRFEKTKIQLDFEGKHLVLADLPFADLSSIPVVVDEISGHGAGSFEKPEFGILYTFHPTIEEQYAASFVGKTQFLSGKLTNKLTGKGKGVKEFQGDFSLPLRFSLEPFVFDISKETSLDGTLNASSDLTVVSRSFLDEGYVINGDLNAAARIMGTLSKPIINGKATLRKGIFVDEYNNIQLVDIEADAEFKEGLLKIVSLTAKDSEKTGSLRASATIGLDNIFNPDISASLNLNEMHLLRNQNYDAWLNTDITLKGEDHKYIISGILSPKEVSIRLPERFGVSIPKLNIVEAKHQKKQTDTLFKKIKLDIKFKADNQIFVSGRGLNSELQGELDITGDLKTPWVMGDLKMLRGRYEAFGRRFILDKAVFRFQGAVPPSPYLDIEASTKVEGITGKILITSSIDSLGVGLASTPALPEDEVLSLILFGKNIHQISPFQAIQLANTLRQFSGKSSAGIHPLNYIQSLVGLDDLRVEGVGSENTRLGAGKYISDKVYLEVEQGTAASSGVASVEIEMTPNVSLESKAKQNGESDIGLFWEWDY